MKPKWKNVMTIPAKTYTCGYCGKLVAPDRGFHMDPVNNYIHEFIYFCPGCEQPTYITKNGLQVPGPTPGDDVANLPNDLESLYVEARRCISIRAFTASVLISRKLLMNIAVQQGAEENLKFIEYVEYLAAKGFVPPNGKGWVDHIRKKGNEATHEIALMSGSDALDLVTFLEMLLKFIFEFPSRIPKAP